LLAAYARNIGIEPPVEGSIHPEQPVAPERYVYSIYAIGKTGSMRQVRVLRGELDATHNGSRIGSILGSQLSESLGILKLFRSQFGPQYWRKKPGFARWTFTLRFRS
jgi:hypothetical protein